MGQPPNRDTGLRPVQDAQTLVIQDPQKLARFTHGPEARVTLNPLVVCTIAMFVSGALTGLCRVLRFISGVIHRRIILSHNPVAAADADADNIEATSAGCGLRRGWNRDRLVNRDLFAAGFFPGLVAVLRGVDRVRDAIVRCDRWANPSSFASAWRKRNHSDSVTHLAHLAGLVIAIPHRPKRRRDRRAAGRDSSAFCDQRSPGEPRYVEPFANRIS